MREYLSKGERGSMGNQGDSSLPIVAHWYYTILFLMA